MERRRDRAAGALSRLFFLSGLSALFYEVLWVRLFTSVLGSGTHAVASVVSAFLLGGALGGLVFGRSADRATSPLRRYAALELATALLSAGAFGLFLGTEGAGSGALFRALGPDAYRAVLYGLALLFVAAPAATLGGALPTLARELVRAPEHLRPAVARLYGVHAAGAALGAIGCVLLVGSLGYAMAYGLAVALTTAIGLAALLLSRRTEGEPAAAHAPERDPGAGDAPTRPRIALAIALSGASALAFEVAWFRLLELFHRGVLVAFGILLAVYLLGLSAGSTVAGRATFAGRERRAFVAVQLAVAFLTVAALPLLAGATGLGSPRGAGITAGLALLLTITFAYGTTLPFAVRLYGAHRGVGRDVGAVYAANTIGSVTGSLAAGYLLVPWLGTQTTLLSLGALNATAALLVAGPRMRVRTGHAIAVFAAAALVAGTARWDARVLSRLLGGGDRLVALEESELSFLSVFEAPDGHRRLLGGPFVSGSGDRVRRRTQAIQGHLPMLLVAPRAEVLEIGYGTGDIARAILAHGPERLDLVELDPAMVRVADRHFGEPPLPSDDPATRLLTVDGRRWLALSDRRYDLVVSDSMFPQSELSMRMYTVEHFRAGRARLAPGGAMLLWIPLSLGSRMPKVMLRTFREVFPHTLLFQTRQGLEAFAVGFRDPPEPSTARLAERYAREAAPSLSALGWTDPAYLLSMLRAGPDGVRELAPDALPVHRDLAPVLDFLPDADDTRLARELRARDPAEAWRRVSPDFDGSEAARRLDALLAADAVLLEGCGGVRLDAPPRDLAAARRALSLFPGHAEARRHLAREPSP